VGAGRALNHVFVHAALPRVARGRRRF
jgi:hypothetical protein